MMPTRKLCDNARAAPRLSKGQAGRSGARVQPGEGTVGMDPKYYRNWHLASNEMEYQITEFEWSIIRCHEAFARWVTAANSVVLEEDITFSESIILQTIRMLDRPKSGVIIARMINRDDVANVQYSLRKLESAGLINKVTERGSKVHAYEVTEKGRSVTDKFARIRSELLVQSLKTVDKLDERIVGATQLLALLTGIYEEVSRTSAALTHDIED